MADNPEHQAMVSQLEASVSAELPADQGTASRGEVPSGDELAEEVERFLRDVGRNG